MKHPWFQWRSALWMGLVGLALQPVHSADLHSRAEGSRVFTVGDQSVKLEVSRALDRGLEWLEKAQDEEGYWSTPDHPALSALALVALKGDPSDEENQRGERQEVIRRGYRFLESCVRPDGGIYGKKELVNYNTAVSMIAFLMAGDPSYDSLLRKARQFLIDLQWDFGVQGEIDDPLDGGIGYGSSYPHSDLSNTLHALEALYHSRHLVEDQGAAHAADLNWEAALQFIENCQNLPEYNKQPWASGDPENRGGFVYFPGNSKAGEMELLNGRKALRSYGSISYAGMLSYVYAGMSKSDPRVQAVLDWTRANYTLDENPGMGLQGLFFYYHTMTKALSLAEVDWLERTGGERHHWRRELALRLINLQRDDGSWKNENSRWWENDPVLVTAYALISLEMIHRAL